jgi:hypothetical protein
MQRGNIFICGTSWLFCLPIDYFYCENKQVNLFCEKNNQNFCEILEMETILSYLLKICSSFQRPVPYIRVS